MQEETKLQKAVRGSKRLTFIANALDVAPERAFILDRFIADIADDELTAFFKYRVGFNLEMNSKEQVTLNAYISYTREKTIKKINKGDFYFDDFDDMVHFIKVHFKNENLVKGVMGFGKNTTLRMNPQAKIVNTEDVNDNGFERILELKEEVKVYEWLFLNQTKIGYAPLIDEGRKSKLQKKLLEKMGKETGLIPFTEHSEEEVVTPHIENEGLSPIDISQAEQVFN